MSVRKGFLSFLLGIALCTGSSSLLGMDLDVPSSRPRRSAKPKRAQIPHDDFETAVRGFTLLVPYPPRVADLIVLYATTRPPFLSRSAPVGEYLPSHLFRVGAPIPVGRPGKVQADGSILIGRFDLSRVGSDGLPVDTFETRDLLRATIERMETDRSSRVRQGALQARNRGAISLPTAVDSGAGKAAQLQKKLYGEYFARVAEFEAEAQQLVTGFRGICPEDVAVLGNSPEELRKLAASIKDSKKESPESADISLVGQQVRKMKQELAHLKAAIEQHQALKRRTAVAGAGVSPGETGQRSGTVSYRAQAKEDAVHEQQKGISVARQKELRKNVRKHLQEEFKRRAEGKEKKEDNKTGDSPTPETMPAIKHVHPALETAQKALNREKGLSSDDIIGSFTYFFRIMEMTEAEGAVRPEEGAGSHTKIHLAGHKPIILPQTLHSGTDAYFRILGQVNDALTFLRVPDLLMMAP